MPQRVETITMLEAFQIAYLVHQGWNYNRWGDGWTKEGEVCTTQDEYFYDDPKTKEDFTLDEAFDHEERKQIEREEKAKAKPAEDIEDQTAGASRQRNKKAKAPKKKRST
jgi:hypothetical protein